MPKQAFRPARRAVLRAGSASVAAAVVGLFLAGRPATAVTGVAHPAPAPYAPAGHRHIIGVL